MALTLKVALWVCLGAIAYNYVGYPTLLYLLATLAQAKSDLVFLIKRKSRRQPTASSYQPQIAILISAFNEEAVIETRIKNLLEVDYPEDLVDVLIGLDAPTDSTAQILSRFESPRVRVFTFPIRRGKLAVISDLAHRTSAQILIFTDANTLFRPDPNLIIEDLQIALDVRFQGYRVIYDPDAVAVEEIALTFTSQFERRIRLGAGDFQTLFGYPQYLNPFKGVPAFAYWSHRVLRWLTPFSLIVAFACSAGLFLNLTYRSLFFAQCTFYAMALLGYWKEREGGSSRLFRLPFYFCSMNTAYIFGLARYLSGRQIVAWAATQ